VPKTVTLREESGFRMDLDELASLVTPKTRMLIINTPQNPTGGVLTDEDVDFVCELAEKHDLLVVSDEIYSQLVYGFQHVSPLSRPGMRERTVLMDGLSKSYAMTGWRLGYAVAPRALAAKLDTLMINSSSCAAAFTQIAAIEALGSPESEHSSTGATSSSTASTRSRACAAPDPRARSTCFRTSRALVSTSTSSRAGC